MSGRANPYVSNTFPVITIVNSIKVRERIIGKYDLDFNGENFMLVSKNTDCLAMDACGIPAKEQLLQLSVDSASSCTPGGGCC